VHLTHLKLENFRGFQSFSVEFHPRMTVLVGVNASGKTAVLDGIAVAIGAWTRGMPQLADEDRPLCVDDVRLETTETQGLATLEPRYPVGVSADATVDATQLHWKRELRRAGGRTTSVDAKQVRRHAAAIAKAASADEQAPLPLFGYYGTGRLWVQRRARPKSREKLGSRFQGYDSCLQSASNTKLFERWMAWRAAERVQRLAAAEEHGVALSTVQSPHLDAVARAACECVDGARRFFYSVAHKQLRIEFDDGRVLPFDRLSDGQRSLVTLAADIAWRAAQLNPQWGARAPEKVQGIVVIDEVELHLHPAWQRTVLDALQRVFPALQFVVTTHSPQVLSTARPEWVRVLRGDGTGPVDATLGRDTNAILQDVMGVPPRPEWMERLLGAVEVALDADDLAEASRLIEEARANLGETDATLAGLLWQLAELQHDHADD